MSTMIKPTLSRRYLLGLATTSVGGALAAVTLGGCGGSGSTRLCADPEQLNDEQMSLRTSLRYTERALGRQTCSGCAFFKAQANAPCGTCELLKGPVNPQGHCDSWSGKEVAAKGGITAQ